MKAITLSFLSGALIISSLFLGFNAGAQAWEKPSDSGANPSPAESCARFRGTLVPMTEAGSGNKTNFCFVGDPEQDVHLGIIDLNSLLATDTYDKSKAILAFLRENTPVMMDTDQFHNPAWAYCLKQGGAMSNYTKDSQGAGGDQYGICTFDDESQIGQWTLFRKDRPLYDLLSDRFPR